MWVYFDGEPVRVPFDPADLDRIPPVDLDVCDHCSGLGEVFFGPDEDGSPVTGECGLCVGTGMLFGGAA